MKYRIRLQHKPNPDITGTEIEGYWEPPADPSYAPVFVDCDSITDCIIAASHFRDRNHLGGGNWTGGHVFECSAIMGIVSYNGKFWKSPHHFRTLDAFNKYFTNPHSRMEEISL